MKTSRKLIVALTMAAMILTMLGTGVVSAAAPTVQSAAFSDISDSDYASAIDWIGALGIINGRPGGIYDPTAPVTREEMAKIVVGLMGQADLADQLSANGANFKDADQIQDWAVGWVNAAQALGVIKGYPDGTFKPLANVSAQEALTMLIRAIGDECKVVEAGNNYPGSNLAAAAVLGISSGVSFAGSLPADRGMIAQFVWQALGSTRYLENADTGRCGSTNTPATMLEQAFAGKVVKTDTSDNKPAYKVTAVGGNTIYLTITNEDGTPGGTVAKTLAGTVTLLGADTLADLVGSNINYALDANGKISLLELATAAPSAKSSGTLNDDPDAIPSFLSAVNASTYGNWYLKDSDGNTFVLFDDGSIVQLDSSVKFKLNGGSETTVPGGNWEGYSATVTKNGNGLGTLVSAMTVDAPNAWVSEAPTDKWSDTASSTISVHLNNGSPATVEIDKDTSVTWNGESMSAKDAYAKIQDDVKAGVYPVLQIATDGSFTSGETATSLTVTDTQVTGTLDSVKFGADGTSVTIGSFTGLVGSGYAKADDPSGANFAAGQFPNIGTEVIALTVNGKVQYLFGPSVTTLSADNYIANVASITSSGSGSSTKYSATFDNKGTTYTLDFASAPPATIGVGYNVVAVNGSNQLDPTTWVKIDDDVLDGGTLTVDALTATSGGASQFTLKDSTGSTPLVIGDASTEHWAIYDADGNFVGDSALALGAQFTATSATVGSDTYYVLIVK